MESSLHKKYTEEQRSKSTTHVKAISRSMNETLFVAEITKLRKEKIECNECLEDLRKKLVDNETKIKECEEKKNELAYKLGCLQQIKDEIATTSNDVLKRESGVTLLKQLTALRKQERHTTAKMCEVKTAFFEMKEKSKHYGSQANEVRKIVKHMKLANQKLWERIDRLCEQYEQFLMRNNENGMMEVAEIPAEVVPVRCDYPNSNKRIKLNDDKCVEVSPMPKDAAKDGDGNNQLVKNQIPPAGRDMNLFTIATPGTPGGKETCDLYWKLNSLEKNMYIERPEKPTPSDDYSVYSGVESVDQSSNRESVSSDFRSKWDVSRRDISLVKIIGKHLYVGSSDGTIKRFNTDVDTEVISYDIKLLKTEGLINSRVKSIFVREEKCQLYVSLDDGFLCCFNVDTGDLIADTRLDSYAVCCVEGWGELIVARSDRNITFLRFTPNFTHIRTVITKSLFQSILAVQALVNEDEDVKHLLVLGKGSKPIIVDAVTGVVVTSISNQVIFSPAFVILNGDTACTVFTQSPESLRNKDSFIAFFDIKKNYERVKIEFARGVVTAAKVSGDLIIIALLRFNFTRILCYNFSRWKHLWTTFIGYEKVFALDFDESSIYFGCRNGCVHRIQVDVNAVMTCDDRSCSCGQPFALLSDLRNIQFH